MHIRDIYTSPFYIHHILLSASLASPPLHPGHLSRCGIQDVSLLNQLRVLGPPDGDLPPRQGVDASVRQHQGAHIPGHLRCDTSERRIRDVAIVRLFPS